MKLQMIGCSHHDAAVEVRDRIERVRHLLPDDLERASAQLAALVLAGQQDAAAETLGMIHRAEQQRRASQ